MAPFLEFPDSAANTRICVLDLFGSVIIDKETEGQTIHKITISGYPSGIYIVKVIQEEKVETRRIILIDN